jgi:ABC-type Fe3+-hydroxamate transport system substrate-binding protein
MSKDLVHKLRQIPEQLRRTPLSVGDVVPLIQQAADLIEALKARLTELEAKHEHLKKRKPSYSMASSVGKDAEVPTIRDLETVLEKLCS